MNRNSPLLSFTSLTIGYRSGHHLHTVASDLSATLRAGDFVCLIGANGTGKSTLLRTLAAFQQPLDGCITIQKKTIESYSKREISKLIGIVLTEQPEMRYLTVREVVALGRIPYTDFFGGLTGQDEEMVVRALESVQMYSFAKRPVSTLSDGERQKVMIAKSLAQETPVMLLDEPTAFLDFQSKVEMMQLLAALAHQNGKAILLSTHDLEMAFQMADKVWLMDGEHLTVGSVNELTEQGELSRFIDRKRIKYNKKNKRIDIL